MKKNKRKLAAILTGLLVATSIIPSVYGEDFYSAPVENSAENSFDGGDSGFTGNSETVDETNEDVQEITEENAEEDTNQTDSSEEADMFSSDFSDGTLSVDDSPQEELESVGGGFSWGKSYEIIPTDVTSAREGCVLLGVKGTYLADQQNILNKINEIRKEACEEGVPDPRNSSRKLIPADYVPIKWSSDLEYIARIRAAESSVRTLSHTRTNNTSCFTLNSPNGIGSYGEVLAWNYSKSTLMGITQWYEEKSAWVSQNLYYETGHYTQMIDPSRLYVGISTFLNDEGSYYNTTAGEFSFQRGLDESRGPGITDCIQLIEVKKDQVKISITGLKDTMNPNEKVAASAVVSGYNCKLSPIDNIVWSSSDSSVASVDSKGNVTAKRGGKTEITATYGNFKASQIIEVGNKIGISEFSVTLSETGYTYDGKEKRPKVTVKNGNSVIDSSNYKVEYVDNVNAGTATVKVTGTGNYSGTATAKFSIFQAHQSVTAVPRESTISVGTTTFIDIKGIGDITCWSSNMQVAEVDAETCLIKGISPGTATITVTAWGNDNYVADNTSFVISVVSSLTPAVTLVDSGQCGSNAKWKFFSDGTLRISGTGEIRPSNNAEWDKYSIDVKKIIVENGITSIASYMFSMDDCYYDQGNIRYSPVSIEIADSVTSIGDCAFYKCDKLKKVSIGKGLNSLGKYVFTYCPELKEINVSAQNQKFTSINGGLYSKNKSILYRLPHNGAKEFTVPEGVETIKTDAMGDLVTLETVRIPASVKTIERLAFDGCNNLKYVQYAGSKEDWEKISISFGNYELLNANITYKKSISVTGLKIGGSAADALRLNWNRNTSAGGYIIEQKKNGSWERIKKIEGNGTTTYRVEKLNASTKYDFRIKAYSWDSASKTSVYSEYIYVSGMTLPNNIYGVKIGGKATDALRLNWNRNTSASGYIIEQKKNGSWVRIKKIEGNGTTTYRVEKLSGSTRYDFRIRAYGWDSVSKVSTYSGYTYVSGTTMVPNVTGMKIGGKATDALRLNWNRNTLVSGYIIEQKKNGSWVRIKKIEGNGTTTYRVEKLSRSTRYEFRIKAYGLDSVAKNSTYSGYTYVSGLTLK